MQRSRSFRRSDAEPAGEHGQTALAGATPTEPLPPELQLKPSVDVAAMKLPVGALVSLTADATDDCYTGPQTTHSRTVTFRIVAARGIVPRNLAAAASRAG